MPFSIAIKFKDGSLMELGTTSDPDLLEIIKQRAYKYAEEFDGKVCIKNEAPKEKKRRK